MRLGTNTTRLHRTGHGAPALFDGEAVGITIENLTKRFDHAGAPAVDRLSLDVEPGSIVVLVGPSGCGKTTTLKLINRLLEPTSGSIRIGGVDIRSVPIHELRRSIGYVIQQTGLFPHRTVEANIATVPRLLGWDRQIIRDRVRELVDTIGLDESLLGRYPSELSGGQQQRVGVARALAADPPLLLMDEPYSAVDPIVRARLQDELRSLQAKLGKTIVLVTHDIDEAIKLGDRIAVLDVGGVLAQYDTPADLLASPADDFVVSFLGEDRIIRRLALLTVADIALSDGPVVDTDDFVSDAIAMAGRHRTDWVGIRNGDKLVGWVSMSELDGRSSTTSVSALGARPFQAEVTRATPLKSALDLMFRSVTGVAVVVDDGRFVGMVTFDDISREVRP